MKNPFIGAAAAIAAMVAQAQNERLDQWRAAYGNLGLGRSSSRTRTPGKRNPAGAKLLRGFYKNVHGVKEDYAEARRWYSALKKGGPQ